ncbi:MAG: hypothetical protein JJT76_11165 [Clostridiaceae bacterium]|nr:hypothetical protein [Clostridiaceae bacterium]
MGKNKAELTNAQKQLVESMIKEEKNISSIYAELTNKDGALKEKGVFAYSESVLYKYIRYNF